MPNKQTTLYESEQSKQLMNNQVKYEKLKENKTAISLFCSSGIGDIALKRIGIRVLVANELITERCELFERNFPECTLIRGSIWDKKDEIINTTKTVLQNQELDFALVTPPCQGMSKNGRGKLLAEIKAGRRGTVDERNQLIIPSLEIIKELNPTTVVFENVPEMIDTIIPYNGTVIGIIDLIKSELQNWHVEEKIVEFANYGIPQRRQRLITIATQNPAHHDYFKKNKTLFPQPTHSQKESLFTHRWRTVRDVIGDLEPLDGNKKPKSKKNLLHFVPKLDDRKYLWVSHTPEGKTAFDNQCYKCGITENLTHTSKKNVDGVNQASTETPIYCFQCGELLPRPVTLVKGQPRLMKGFTSAYKRMSWDLPASAITRNFPYVCSDNKIHPSQHRSLSVYEACLLHTIKNNEYIFEYKNGKTAGFTAIRDTLGESIPPQFLEILFKHLSSIY